MSDSPTRPNPLLALGGQALEFALNRAVALDPDLPGQLQSLEGRSIELELAAPKLAARIEVQAGRLAVGPAQPTQEPDLSLKATLGAVLSRVLPGATQATPGRMKIAGDIELAQALQRIAQRYSPDLEAALSARLGDIVGVQIAKALRAALEGVRRGSRELTAAGADYLRDEAGVLVGRAELDAFCEDVDSLRDGVERSERRLQRLQQRLPSES
ncbi:ubiquinone biosynthesis accessory factor UbiJ [Aquimonas voraii]|uniref:Ubiquinone biosynthesis accessory factor UbiJ n=1 Tax=Aquimonas voraii TaxID=265719 RepID=A0A1G6WIH7_9GAMM|nr:SCP2 sterol-binding domain-containing protein [Aquimonas voraii]SDD65608.1 ubiquinone biosynthesis protein UbiJ [Aquimonas voraii]